MSMAPSFADLRRLSDDELRARHDELARSTQVGLAWYRDEIHRREIERHTRMSARLAWLIAVMTAMNVVLFLISLFVD